MVEIGVEQEETEEKMKNMSPEQLKDYQKQNCIFCQIISGKVQSKRIYEDERCIAILDINPANPGHILLLPKEHYAVMPQIPEHDIGHLFNVSKALSSCILKGLKVTGTNIFIANGVAAGQRAQHFMIHIIPRKENDGISSLRIPQRQIPDSDLEIIRKRMADVVAKVFGLETPKEEKKSDKEDIIDKEDNKEKSREGKPKEEKLVKLPSGSSEKKDAGKPDLDKIARLLR
jgi:histidine triad (HIT) family protein